MKRQRTHHKFRKVAMRNLAEFSGGSAIRYFTLTRKKNEGGAPSGATLTFIGVHIADFDALWIAHNFIIWINRSNTMSHPCDG